MRTKARKLITISDGTIQMSRTRMKRSIG